MQKYSVFSLIKNAFSDHQNWEVAWKDPTPKSEYDVVIIGGGIVGSLLALILGLNGLKITVIDRQKKDKLFSKDHYVKSYALNQGSSNLLNILNIWDTIKTKSQPIDKILLKQGSSISSIQPFELIF